MEEKALPLHNLYMETIFSASTFETQIIFSLYLLPPSFVKIPTLMMYTYLGITLRLKSAKPIVIPITTVCARMFFLQWCSI